MERACRLAKETAEIGWGGPFGAVIAKDGEVVVQGCNRVLQRCDPTAHAEIEAIRAAGALLGPTLLPLVDSPTGEKARMLAGYEMYSSSAPCPMCLSAIYWARLDAVYFSQDLEKTRKMGFDDVLQYRELAKPYAEQGMRIEQLRPDLSEEAYQAWQSRLDKHLF